MKDQVDATWEGAPEIVLRLAKGLAVIWMPDGGLYTFEQQLDDWRFHLLTEYRIDRVDVRDLDGDGWPELSSSWTTGSRAILVLRIVTWDGAQLKVLFHHQGASEPGLYRHPDKRGIFAQERVIAYREVSRAAKVGQK